MRRSEREIKSFFEILDVIEKSDVVRVSFFDGEYPYIVPLSFGFEANGENIRLYFHCASEGKKIALIQKNNKVCFECDIFEGYHGSGMNVTTFYKSVIGVGEICKCENEEKVKGLELLMKHCGYEAEREMLLKCARLEKTTVFRLDVKKISGKSNG